MYKLIVKQFMICETCNADSLLS